uniref:Uncharacterized protein n=1 Tax=Arundo donax TaxID=35708 RepID=A0A0A9BG97_ARUDO
MPFHLLPFSLSSRGCWPHVAATSSRRCRHWRPRPTVVQWFPS